MQQVLKIISGVGIFVIVLFTWFFTRWYYKIKTKPDNQEYYQAAIYDSMYYEIAGLKEDKKVLADSIFAVRVEKGFVEIELNRSEAELSRLINNYRVSKVKRDTVMILRNADSVIHEMEGKYLPVSQVVFAMNYIIDSMQQVQLRFSDSIEGTHNNLINSISSDLHTERVNNQVLRDKANKKKKVPIFAAIGGFVAGILTIVFIQ